MGQEILAPLDRQTALAEPAMAERLAKVEFDQQIATARAFPRSIEKAVASITTLATLDAETAQDCMYVLPRGGKNISGPSARLAEIIASQWGNNRTAARVVYVDRQEGFIEAEGIFHDLETNSASTARVRRRILDSKGKVYNEDMIIVTGNAACSIARRNAILNGVPKPAWRRAYDRAQAVIKGDVKSVATTRDELVAAFSALGVPAKAIAASLDLKSINDVKLNDVVTLRSMYATLRSGEASIEEMFGEHMKTATGKLQPLSTGPDIPEADEAAPTGKAEQQQTPAQQAQTPAAQAQPEKQEAKPAQQSAVSPKTEATDDMFPGDRPSSDQRAAEQKGTDWDEKLATLETDLRNCEDMDELDKVRAKYAPLIRSMPNAKASRAKHLIDEAIFAAT